MQSERNRNSRIHVTTVGFTTSRVQTFSHRQIRKIERDTNRMIRVARFARHVYDLSPARLACNAKGCRANVIVSDVSVLELLLLTTSWIPSPYDVSLESPLPSVRVH